MTRAGTIQYGMRLHIARFNPDLETFETIPNYITTINGHCGNSGIGEFEKSLDLNVLAGDFIVVEVEECSTGENMTVCPFLPVVESSDSTSCILHSDDLDLRTRRKLCGMLLAIEAHVQPRKLYLVVKSPCFIQPCPTRVLQA